VGRYFNPATETAIKAAGGRRLEISYHDHLLTRLSAGESLGIFLDRYAFKQMADVTNASEFQEFWRQVEAGAVSFLGFYAMPSGSFK
jgi:hypothetical protein